MPLPIEQRRQNVTNRGIGLGNMLSGRMKLRDYMAQRDPRAFADFQKAQSQNQLAREMMQMQGQQFGQTHALAQQRQQQAHELARMGAEQAGALGQAQIGQLGAQTAEIPLAGAFGREQLGLKTAEDIASSRAAREQWADPTAAATRKAQLNMLEKQIANIQPPMDPIVAQSFATLQSMLAGGAKATDVADYIVANNELTQFLKSNIQSAQPGQAAPRQTNQAAPAASMFPSTPATPAQPTAGQFSQSLGMPQNEMPLTSMSPEINPRASQANVPRINRRNSQQEITTKEAAKQHFANDPTEMSAIKYLKRQGFTKQEIEDAIGVFRKERDAMIVPSFPFF